jgi:peptide/nickel transport system ATP-binding protein
MLSIRACKVIFNQSLSAQYMEKFSSDPRSPLLQVRNLTTQFQNGPSVATAVDDVSFHIMPGQIMGIVGESGCGKSVTGYSIMGLVDPPGKVVNGEIIFNGSDLRLLSPSAMRAVRGNRIAMIFQDAMMALNPVLRIDTQMIEAIRAHQNVSHKAARLMAREALVQVGIASADTRLLNYPHQFSGGMRQRVAIAIALVNKPDLIICDEPTTALDVTIQAQILSEMQALCRNAGTALIWITHDLSVVAGFADTVCVMYAGKIVESGSIDQVFDAPCHPYTVGLLASAPARGEPGQRLHQIAGTTPSLWNLPTGCAFRTRCPRGTDICHTFPLTISVDQHAYCCFHPLNLEQMRP